MFFPALLPLLLAPTCLGIGFRDRFATFYDSDDCDAAGETSQSIGYSMNNDKCIYQKNQNRKSLWPGKIATSAGMYCFVWYQDDHCDCIEGARKIYTNFKKEVECENKMVAGHESYHFEPAIEGTCPTKGCYGSKTVEWEYVEQDSQFLEDGE